MTKLEEAPGTTDTRWFSLIHHLSYSQEIFSEEVRIMHGLLTMAQFSHTFSKNVREDSCEGRAFHIITQYFHLVRWGAGFSCPLVGRGGSARAFLSCASPHMLSALCYPNLNNILCTRSPLFIDPPTFHFQSVISQNGKTCFPYKVYFNSNSLKCHLGGPLHIVKFNNQGMFVLLMQTYVRAQLL